MDAQEIDDLVRLVDDAADVIGGEVKRGHVYKQECLPGLPAGVQYRYTVSVADNGDTEGTIVRVASFWAENGVEVVAGADGSAAMSPSWEDTDGPVSFLKVLHFEAHNDLASEFEVEGISLCLPEK